MKITVDGTLRRGDWSIRFDHLEFGPHTTALVGANGVGKTSLLRLIAGLEAIDDGEVTIDGLTVDRPEAGVFVAAHKRPVAMVFQEARLFPHLQVVDNVAFPMRRRGASRLESRRRAAVVLDQVGLSEFGRAMPADLSGGQAQRVAIARALATDVELLLLDEPLSSIDDASKPVIRELLGQSRHRTVLWVTHDDADADAADHVISLAESPA